MQRKYRMKRLTFRIFSFELRSVYFERRQAGKFVWVRNESGESPSNR